MQIEVRVGVSLLSGLVLDGVFKLHGVFGHIVKTNWPGRGIWRLCVAFWGG